jgi:CRISPR-associated protein Csm2
MRNTIKICRDEIRREQIKRAIEDGGNYIVEIAEPIGECLARGLRYSDRLSRSQIRNIFTIAKKMQMKETEFNREEFILLKPKISYLTKKTGSNQGARIFGDILIEAVDATYNGGEKYHFKNFMDFFEAILAYHVSYGGK